MNQGMVQETVKAANKRCLLWEADIFAKISSIASYSRV